MEVVHKLTNEQSVSDYKQQVQKNILYASYQIRKHQETILARYNINLQKYNILNVLYAEFPEALSQNQIRDRIIDKSIDLSRIIKQLDETCFIKHMRHRDNKRRSEIIITPKGIELVEDIMQRNSEMNYPMSNISKEEAQQVAKLLQKVTNVLAEAVLENLEQVNGKDLRTADWDRTVA